MLLARLRTCAPVGRIRCLSTQAALSEYTEEPKYPEILDLSFEARQYRKKKEVIAKRIQALPTVEEKIMSLNMKKYFGYKCIMLNDQTAMYNSLPFIQYATRTKLNETGEELPEYYGRFNAAAEKSLADVKTRVEEAIFFELECYKQAHDLTEVDLTVKQKADLLSSAIVAQVHRVVADSLASEHAHLKDIETDSDPVHEAFWMVGGIEPLTIVQKIRDGQEWQKPHKMDPVDRPFQYIGNPHLAVRHEKPLPAVAPVLHVTPEEIPQYTLDPRTLGYSTAYRHGAVAPGFWPGHKTEFGLLSYQRRTAFKELNPKWTSADVQEAIHAQGISGLFGWVLGQAYYQGFTTMNELTYPLAGQSIMTDGQFWSFYVYQLNTTLMHSHFAQKNELANECWGTKELKLYEEVNEKGQLTGFNDQIIKNLLRLYLNAPEDRVGVNMKPFLKAGEQYVSDIQHGEKRRWLDSHYKQLVSNKPRHKLPYEVYNWEKIYMIDHNTRPLAAKRRPFQLRYNPYDKHLNAHSPKYLPKALRPDGPKSKQKRENTYYPDIYKEED